MKRFESRVERMDAEERKLANHSEGLTIGYFAREFGVDRSTIHRDFSALERRGTGLIKDGRRWRLDHRRSMYGAKFTPYELVALYIGARLLSRHSDEQNPHVTKALEKLADALHAHSPLVANHLAAAAASVGVRPSRPEYVAAFEALTLGWIERRKVHLTYSSYSSEAGTDAPTERLFAPYFLEPVGIGFSCYAIGMDELRGEVRTLKLERVRTARITDERFTLPAGFDPYQKLASAWGIMWSEDEPVEVRLRFHPRVVRRVKESYWHPSQQLQELLDGSCVFTVQIGNTLELRPWIRQWGADVEVLAPQPLRDELAAEARALAALYAPH